jgi:hypothetical protein
MVWVLKSLVAGLSSCGSSLLYLPFFVERDEKGLLDSHKASEESNSVSTGMTKVRF